MSNDTILDTPSQSEVQAAAPDDRHRRFRAIALWQTIGPVTVFVALFILVSALQPAFLTGGGLGILTTQATPILLVALGQAMVLHVGSLDLSNAAMAVFAAILLAMTLGPLGVVGIVATLVIVTALGALNGALVAYGQVPSFALTLGTLGILEAAALVVSHATTVYVTANAGLVSPLFDIAVFTLPLAFWVGLLIAVALWALLRFTRLGGGLTAVGLNETAALFSGLRTRGLKVVAFAASGALAGVAGIMIVAQAGAASTSGLGSDLLLPGIAAAIVGGTAISGGVTNPLNVVIGSLTIALIPIGAAAVGITPQAQSLVYGVVIVVAVALTASRGRGVIVK